MSLVIEKLSNDECKIGKDRFDNYSIGFRDGVLSFYGDKINYAMVDYFHDEKMRIDPNFLAKVEPGYIYKRPKKKWLFFNDGEEDCARLGWVRLKERTSTFIRANTWKIIE